jgi:hypothetical protein
MKDNLLGNNIKNLLLSNFPNARVLVSPVRLGISRSSYFTVTFGAIGNISELTSRIEQNDPVGHKWIIWVNGEDKYLAESISSGISINPTEKYYAMGTVKTKFRKVSGDSNSITRAFTRFSDRLVGLVRENESNIYQRAKYSDKYFAFS